MSAGAEVPLSDDPGSDAYQLNKVLLCSPLAPVVLTPQLLRNAAPRRAALLLLSPPPDILLLFFLRIFSTVVSAAPPAAFPSALLLITSFSAFLLFSPLLCCYLNAVPGLICVCKLNGG